VRVKSSEGRENSEFIINKVIRLPFSCLPFLHKRFDKKNKVYLKKQKNHIFNSLTLVAK